MRTVTGPTDHVVVVGAGLAGLSAALHLAGAGREVTVVEREDSPGGRAGRLARRGHLIDTGPTVLTMPEYVEEAMAAVGASMRDHLKLVPLHPAYRAHFADGSVLDVHTDGAAMEAEIRRFAGPGEAAGYRRLRRWLTQLYRVEEQRFIDANFDSPLDLVRPELLQLTALGGFGRLDTAIRRFISDERLRRVFSFQALYAGLDPARALALYGVISYMDTVHGVWFPKGGMHAVPSALAEVAANAGVKFQYSSEVRRLERTGDRITAVHTSTGERIVADAVVITADLPVADRLLGVRRRRRVRWAPSAVVLHAASTHGWTDAHHTISFGQSWRRTFDEIIHRGRLMSDPSLLVTRPTASDPELAPNGRQLHYVLAPCPNLEVGRIDWKRIGPAYCEELLTVLSDRGFPATAEDVELLHAVTPLDWAAQGHAVGTPFSAAHTFTQTGPFRPGNMVRGLANAVLAGSGTTPGVGVPPVLLSGKLAAQRVTGRA